MATYSLAELARSGIYQIVNTVNGKRYIGSAKSLKVRWRQHLGMLRKGAHHSPHLQGSWNAYGESAFRFEVVEFCEVELCIAREQFHLDASQNLFNVCLTAGSTLGRRHSESTKSAIRARAVGRKCSPRTDEYRAALSAAHAGRPKPASVMKALQDGRARQIYTDARRERISLKLKAGYETGLRAREKTESHKNKIGQFYAKLSDDQVREIRRLRAQGVTGRELAKRFNSNAGTICEICKGKRYRWVPLE